MKKFPISLILLIICACFPLFAEAFYAPLLTVVIENAPENAVYCDILLPDEYDKGYDISVLNAYGIESDSEIVMYDNNGYVSYTFRCGGQSSNSALYRLSGESVLRADYFNDAEGVMIFSEIISFDKNIKLALCDIEGNILSVTSEFGVSKKKFCKNVDTLIFDCRSGEVDIEYVLNAKEIAVLCAFVLLFFVLQLVIRWVIRRALKERISAHKGFEAVASAVISIFSAFGVAFALFAALAVCLAEGAIEKRGRKAVLTATLACLLLAAIEAVIVSVI